MLPSSFFYGSVADAVVVVVAVVAVMTVTGRLMWRLFCCCRRRCSDWLVLGGRGEDGCPAVGMRERNQHPWRLEYVCGGAFCCWV
jgi:hypothetical protein